MRNLFVALLLVFSIFTTASAQNVYKEVKKISQQAYLDDTKSELERAVARFRIDALEYMAVMSAQYARDSTTLNLDKQSYALYEFTYIYYNTVKKLTSKLSIDNLRKTFKVVSLESPRFNDDDVAVALKYINNKQNMTPFCLNTNWEKAVAKLKEKGYYYEP